MGHRRTRSEGGNCFEEGRKQALEVGSRDYRCGSTHDHKFPSNTQIFLLSTFRTGYCKGALSGLLRFCWILHWPPGVFETYSPRPSQIHNQTPTVYIKRMNKKQLSYIICYTTHVDGDTPGTIRACISGNRMSRLWVRRSGSCFALGRVFGSGS